MEKMEVVDLFLELLSRESVTPNDGGILDFVESYLDGFEMVRVDRNGVKNLFAYKKFGDGEHLCFAGHVDVVPAGDGWESDPFTPLIKDGKIYARGAQDMKSGVCALLQAMKETESFNGTLSLILTSDEEGVATDGTIAVLEYLEDKNMLPDYTIVAEPTCEERFGDAIKIGRRGSINGTLKLRGRQGHAAYPSKSINPVNLLAPVLPKIAGVNLDEGDEFFEPSQFVITDIRGGIEVCNVTPNDIKIMFNVRNSTKTTKDDLQRFVEKSFEGLDFELELAQSAKPFVTSPDSKVVQILEDAIKSVCGEKPKYSTAGGTSDARFLAEFGVKSIEFGVINDTIHAPNERCSIDEVEKLYQVFKKVIKNF